MKNSDYCEHMVELWKAIEELQDRVKKLEEEGNGLCINSTPVPMGGCQKWNELLQLLDEVFLMDSIV